MDRFLRMLLVFFLAYFAVSYFLPNKDQQNDVSGGDISVKMVDATIPQGNLVKFEVRNNTDTPITLSEGVSPPENFSFERKENGRWEKVEVKDPQKLPEPLTLAAKEAREFSYSELNTELFFKPGEYRVVVSLEAGQEFDAEFEVYEPGFFRTLFRAVYKLIYNFFVLFLLIGNHNLGFAIIMITIVVKLLLWGFNQKSLESQQRMQKLQPELKRLREKYKNDQQKLAMETMALWKKHNISPFSTLTPVLVQFPVLIALFYVIREGLLPHNRFLLYPPFQNFDFSSIQEIFLGIFNLANHPLNDMRLIWLPFLVGAAQFAAMKLSFARTQKKKEAEKKENPPSDKAPSMMDQMESMNKTMMYIFPAMIFFFTLTFPAGVGIYWLISTLIGIGQQHIANKKVHK